MDEAAVREAWELRLEMLTLTTSREDDWAYFSRFVAGPDRCLFSFVDPDGALQGFFSIAFMPFQHAGRRGLLMYSKYFYFRRAYRGHPKTVLAPWKLVPLSIRRFGLRHLHFVTTAFPQSYVSLYRTSGRVYSLREPDTPEWQRHALHAFATEFCGEHFDAQTGLVGGSNVADSPSAARSEEARALAAKYEQLNPNWRDGFALPIIFNVDARLVFHNVKRVLRGVRR